MPILDLYTPDPKSKIQNLKFLHYFAGMKQLLKISFLFLLLAGCNSTDEQTVITPEDDLDAARNFIRSTLDGNYKTARTLILPDSVNTEWLDIYERSYNEKMSAEDKKAYKNASINIHELQKISDTLSIVHYSNSYFKKDTHQLKMIKTNNRWLVDFKHYFETKKDSVP